MAVLRPFITPTVGIPTQAIAPPRQRKMTNPDFFTSLFSGAGQQQMMQQSQEQGPSPALQTREAVQQPEFEQTNNTAPYLQQQLQNYANRAAPPMLEPEGRVRSPNMELVQPSNFKSLYERLAAIGQQAQEMLGAEQARTAFRNLQAMRTAGNVPVGSNGMPIGYKNTGGGGGSGVGAAGSALGLGGSTPLSGNKQQAMTIMQKMAKQWGWTGGQWDALYKLIMKESGFNPNAANPTSSARGLFQKMTSIHGPLENTIEGQILWGFNYIKNRYGNPLNALNFHLGHNWY